MHGYHPVLHASDDWYYRAWFCAAVDDATGNVPLQMARAKAMAAAAAAAMGHPMDHQGQDSDRNFDQVDHVPRRRSVGIARPPVKAERRRSLDMGTVLALGMAGLEADTAPRKGKGKGKGKGFKVKKAPPPSWDDNANVDRDDVDVVEGVRGGQCERGGTAAARQNLAQPSPAPRAPCFSQSAYDDHVGQLRHQFGTSSHGLLNEL